MVFLGPKKPRALLPAVALGRHVSQPRHRLVEGLHHCLRLSHQYLLYDAGTQNVAAHGVAFGDT